MSNPEYEIPLSPIYDDNGPYVGVEIKNERLYIVDRTGPKPYDLIDPSRSEIEELVHILIAYLNKSNDSTLGYGSKSGNFEDYRVDD